MVTPIIIDDHYVVEDFPSLFWIKRPFRRYLVLIHDSSDRPQVIAAYDTALNLFRVMSHTYLGRHTYADENSFHSENLTPLKFQEPQAVSLDSFISVSEAMHQIETHMGVSTKLVINSVTGGTPHKDSRVLLEDDGDWSLF